jgi:hypothetical protein
VEARHQLEGGDLEPLILFSAWLGREDHRAPRGSEASIGQPSVCSRAPIQQTAPVLEAAE